MLKYTIIILLILITPASADELDDIISFLDVDQTDTHEYLPWYSCGHYSRDLAKNASYAGVNLGVAICSNNPRFKYYDNHPFNYIELNGTLYFIEAQTDFIMQLDEVFMYYRYIKFYPDGTQAPSYWTHKMKYDLTSVPNL